MSSPRVMLVNPPHSLEERYGSMKTAGNTMPSLGLLGLAAILRREGFRVAVVDAPSRNLACAGVLREIASFAPQAVGMTAFTPSIHNAGRLAELVKERHPGLKVALGGPHLSAVPVETMRLFPAFDAGAAGEADGFLARLFRTLVDGGDAAGIPGVIARAGGEPVAAPRPPAFKDLDSLPFPAWDLLPGFPRRYRPAAHTYRRLPAATMFTARGCPEQCTFCDRAVFGNAVRSFSADYVVEQMEFLIRSFGIRDITIYDDIFPLFRPRLLRICELIRSRGLDLTWSCNSRVNLAEPDTLRAMREAGCHQIGYGIESGDQSILDRVVKRTRLEQVERAVRLTEEAGIRTKGFFILGLPGETPGTIRRTIQFAKRLPLSDYQTCFFTPFPGTGEHAEAWRHGTLDGDWRRMNLLTPVFVPHGMTAAELARWSARSYREFYLRPRVIWRYLTNLRRPEHLVQVARGAVALARSALGSGTTQA